jgi:hypothetical protein
MPHGNVVQTVPVCSCLFYGSAELGQVNGVAPGTKRQTPKDAVGIWRD